MKPLLTICVVSFWVIVLAGCDILTPANEDIKKLTEQDPDFKQVLANKQSIDTEIASAVNEFYAYKNGVDLKISALKKEYKSQKAQINLRLKDLKNKLNPERQDLAREIIIIKNELKIKSKDLSSIRTRRAMLQDMLTNKKSAIDDVTRQKWDEELKTLELKENPLNDEVQSLKYSLRLTYYKLSLLKQ